MDVVLKEVEGKIESVEQKHGKTRGLFHVIKINGTDYNYRPEEKEVDKSPQLIPGAYINAKYKESTYPTSQGMATARWITEFSTKTPLDQTFENVANNPTPVKPTQDIRMVTKARMAEALHDALDIVESLDTEFSTEDIQKIAVTLYLDRRRV